MIEVLSFAKTPKEMLEKIEQEVQAIREEGLREISGLPNSLKAIKDLVENKHVNVDARDYSENTALMNACEKGIFSNVKYLVENGANVNGKNCKNTTPLMLACLSGNLEVVKYLVNKGAKIDVKNHFEDTPYSYAKTDEIKAFLKKAEKAQLEKRREEHQRKVAARKASPRKQTSQKKQR